MMLLNFKPMRIIFASLLLLLILTLTVFGAQLFATNHASAQAPEAINNPQRAAILGGEQLLLNPVSTTLHLPLVRK
jgi:hypothetical protein